MCVINNYIGSILEYWVCSVGLSVCTETGSIQEHTGLFRQAFAGIQNKLVNEIEVEGGLWTEMQAREVLSSRLISTCRSQVYWSLILELWKINISYYDSICLAFRNVPTLRPRG